MWGTHSSRVSVRETSRLRAVLLTMAWAAALPFAFPTASSADEAEAAGVRHTIAVFLSSLSADKCFFNGSTKAIKHFVKSRVAEINRSPEFPNQSFRFEFYENSQDPRKPEGRKIAEQNMRKALADPTVVAMVGLSSMRAGSWFKEMGKEIAASNIPFLSDIDTANVYASIPNVFSMRPSQEEERAPIVSRFLQDAKFQRPVFIGSADSLGIDAFVESMRRLPGALPMAAVYRVDSGDLGPVTAILDDINSKQADVVMVALNTNNSREFLKQATGALSAPVLFVFGNDTMLSSQEAAEYGRSNNLFQLLWESVPGVYNNRLREEMQKDAAANWLFEDVKNSSAEGWTSGQCKEKDTSGQPASAESRALSPDNMRAVTRGTQFADMIGLIGEIARATYDEQPIPAFRKAMLDKLKSDYVVGRGMYRGKFDNWSFRALSRSASRTPFVAMRLRGEPHVQLAPTQYARLRSDALRPIQTIYMDLDVVRVFRVDDSDKSFFAEFYISMRSDDRFDLSSIEFGNAFRDADRGAAKVTISMVHDGSPNGVYPEGVVIARVVGKFMTVPDLSAYPFDTQLFSIQLQPKTHDAAFIIQPHPAAAREVARRLHRCRWLEETLSVRRLRRRLHSGDGCARRGAVHRAVL